MWDMLILVGSGSTGHVISAFNETEVLKQFFFDGTSTWGRPVLPIIMHHFLKDIYSSFISITKTLFKTTLCR